MSTGGYFIIGGIKGGQKHKKLLRSLFNQINEPRVLYIGAACSNIMKYKISFEKSFRNMFANAEVSTLSLTPEMSLYSGHGRREKLSSAFSNANIIYFDGGDVKTLKRVFERFELKSYCEEAILRGAFVGGLCAGGSILAERIVHDTDGKVQEEEGVGLLPGVAISCHINDLDQSQERLGLLLLAAQNDDMKAVGLSDNQLVIVPSGTSDLMALVPPDDEASPCLVRPDNKLEELSHYQRG